MTYAESNYLGSAIAANNQASFTFTYLDVSEIRVDITVSGTTTTYTTSSNPAGFSIISPNQFVTLSSHPADSDTIRIYRVTNLDNTRATFVAGSAISANDLNNNYTQVLHASQETRLESASASTTATAASSAVSGATATANTALSTANIASTDATNALNAVNNVVAYTVVANVSSLPTSPSDGDRIEISDSTNAESTSSITGLPSNFVGTSGINLRLQYSSSSSSFVFVDYIVQDPDSRYGISNQNTRTTDSVTFAGITGPLTGNVTGDVTGNVTGDVTGDVTGNSSTATTLQTARNIGGVSFDGSANINLPGVNTAGNQDTSGNAATATNATTATTLQTARTINGTSFDGSADIVVGNIPQNSQTSAYTLVVGDAGKHVNITTGGVTVPSGVFSVGDAVSIFNDSTSNQTITQGSSVTLRQAGTANTGNRTLTQYGICTVLCVATNEFVITGSGLS